MSDWGMGEHEPDPQVAKSDLTDPAFDLVLASAAYADAMAQHEAFYQRLDLPGERKITVLIGFDDAGQLLRQCDAQLVDYLETEFGELERKG